MWPLGLLLKKNNLLANVLNVVVIYKIKQRAEQFLFAFCVTEDKQWTYHVCVIGLHVLIAYIVSISFAHCVFKTDLSEEIHEK